MCLKDNMHHNVSNNYENDLQTCSDVRYVSELKRRETDKGKGRNIEEEIERERDLYKQFLLCISASLHYVLAVTRLL
ncbi:hypothetical protein Syun_019624 [Stephania yunnanensis]|uniref:Uncharacterized protein n=1 Tax=Stephania yunnanensis TaxID=152371 RepID=A0AAP0IUE5_9MAGN